MIFILPLDERDFEKLIIIIIIFFPGDNNQLYICNFIFSTTIVIPDHSGSRKIYNQILVLCVWITQIPSHSVLCVVINFNYCM